MSSSEIKKMLFPDKKIRKAKKVKQSKTKKKVVIKTAKGKELGLKRIADFETYALWKSLPSVLRGKSEQELSDMGFDDIVVDLLEIKNQAAFAVSYKVDPATLSDWNKRVWGSKEFNQGRVNWAKRLTSGMLLALHEKALKEGDAPRIKLFYQIVEGWIEKSKTESEDSQAIAELAKTMRKFAEKK